MSAGLAAAILLGAVSAAQTDVAPALYRLLAALRHALIAVNDQFVAVPAVIAARARDDLKSRSQFGPCAAFPVGGARTVAVPVVEQKDPDTIPLAKSGMRASTVD